MDPTIATGVHLVVYILLLLFLIYEFSLLYAAQELLQVRIAVLWASLLIAPLVPVMLLIGCIADRCAARVRPQ